MKVDMISRQEVIEMLENMIKYYDNLRLIIKKDSNKYIEVQSKIQLLTHLVVEIEELK